MLDIWVSIYLDDFLIYSKSYKEHVVHVSKVLERIIDSKLAVNLKKCVFHTETLEFLGYQVSRRGVNMCPDRVATIKDWKEPTDLKSLQSFLGFCNFYRSFIKDYSLLATPLTNLCKKSHEWSWSDTEQKAFDALKLQFTQLI